MHFAVKTTLLFAVVVCPLGFGLTSAVDVSGSGSPAQGALAVSPATLPPGTSSRANPPDPQWSQWFGSYEGHLDIYGTVYDMVVFQNQLYVCGAFAIDPDGNGTYDIFNVARWNETTWEEVDSGVSHWDVWWSLVEYQGQLYGGGDFGLDVYNGSWFSNVDTFTGNTESVHDLLVSGGDLYVGGSFTSVAGAGLTVNNVATYNPTNGWSAIPSLISTTGVGVDDDVWSLGLYEDQVYVGGDFFYPGSSSVGKIGRVESGTLTKVAEGLSGWSNYHGVHALLEYNDKLYVGGAFNQAHQSGGGILSCEYVVETDGTSWTGNLDGGIDFHCFFDVPVLDFAVFDDDGNGEALFVGGHFIQYIGSLETKRVAKWDDSGWHDVRGGTEDPGCDTTVWSLLPFEEDLYVGGEFYELTNRDPNTGHEDPISVGSIARYATQHYLAANSYTLSESCGCSIDILLDAGPANAGRTYILLGGVSGTSPGSAFPLVTMPLNWDPLTDFILGHLNTPVFSNFAGQLDANGQAVAQLNSTPFTGLAGTTVYFAFVTYGPIDYTSTPMMITITP